MTKAETVRSNFKAFLPRIVRNDLLTWEEAIRRTLELLDLFRAEMHSEGLDDCDVAVGLVFTQPETPGFEHVPAQSLAVPPPEGIPAFAELIKGLDRPIFLGVLFVQFDRETTKVSKFVWPFMADPEAEKGLIYVRDRAPDIMPAMPDLSKRGYDA